MDKLSFFVYRNSVNQLYFGSNNLHHIGRKFIYFESKFFVIFCGFLFYSKNLMILIFYSNLFMISYLAVLNLKKKLQDFFKNVIILLTRDHFFPSCFEYLQLNVL